MTWAFQVMPVFFLVGGYVNARSWPSQQARGETWTDMVGSGNTNPPSIALLAHALAQCGLVLALEPAGTRLLLRPAVWRCVRRLNTAVMSFYLWHFVPVILVAIAFYRTGILPQPAIGSAEWWELRPVWFALLTVVLAALVVLVMRAERPLLKIPPAVGRPGWWSPVILLAGLAAAMFGLTRLAIAGLAPGGHLPLLALAAFTAGLLATFGTGHPSSADDHAHPASGPVTPVAPGVTA